MSRKISRILHCVLYRFIPIWLLSNKVEDFNDFSKNLLRECTSGDYIGNFFHVGERIWSFLCDKIADLNIIKSANNKYLVNKFRQIKVARFSSQSNNNVKND